MSPDPHAGWKPRFNPWLIAITVTLATFMEVLDTSIANVALPHIAGNLSSGVDESTWVLTSYLVANAIILPLSGWFSSIMGRKRYYMASVAMFTLSSVLSGLAPSLKWLIIFRIMQGLGGGGLQPSEQAILADTFSIRQRGMAMALYGVAVVTAPIIGPTLGGWITDNFTWRWIFFINLPVGILSMYLTSRIVEDPPYLRRRSRSEARNVDYIGLSMIALGIGALQFVLDKGQREDWFSSHLIVAMSVVAGLALLFALVWELQHKDPIADVHLLGERNFFFSNVLMFVLGFTLYGSTVLLPLFLQTLMGYTATIAGLVLSPGGFVTMLSMPLVGFLLARETQPRWLILFGFTVVSFSMFYMSRFDLAVDYRTAMLSRMIQAGGLGFLFVPINSTAYSYVPREKNTNASGLINLSRNIGGSAGIAFSQTLLARKAQVHQSFLVAHMTPFDIHFQTALQRLSQVLMTRGASPVTSRALAQAGLYGQLGRQASMLAYIDTFRILGYILILAMPVIFLMKKVRPHSDAPIH
jgi:DHA2 family multidrug resistance protein